MALKIKRTLIDLLDLCYLKITKRKDIPPYFLRAHVGHIEEFERIPQEYIAYFKLLCGLTMDQSILDIGCGPGRFASQLICSPNFFHGQYCGFDVDKKGIDWANRNIAAYHKNFEFKYVDLFNGHYNPRGRLQAATFSFPYEDERFDFVFAMSVFTHLLPNDTRNYLRQISRVLKSRGKALLTFFLLDGYPKVVSEITLKRTPRPRGPTKWQHHDEYSLIYPENPEALVMYQESAVIRMMKESGLQIDRIYWGAWNKLEDYLSFQDVLIAHK